MHSDAVLKREFHCYICFVADPKSEEEEVEDQDLEDVPWSDTASTRNSFIKAKQDSQK